MTKKIRFIFAISLVCLFIFTSCTKENTTVTNNTTAITTEQKHPYDDLSTCAGTLTYALCEKAAKYCDEHEIFPDKLTVCDYNLDGKADIFVDGGLITYAGYPLAAVISDGFNSFSYYNDFDFMPTLYQNNVTGEKEFIAVAGSWFSSDSYRMGVYSINGNSITVPYAAVSSTGYVGGGFTQFGFSIAENISIEDSSYNLVDYKCPDNNNYPELFYSGMYYGDCYIFMQNYTKCEEVPQLAVAAPYKFPDDIDNISNTELVAQDFYNMFSDPVPVEPDKINDSFNTKKGSIICVNEVKESDTAKYKDETDSEITVSEKVCKNVTDFLHKILTDKQDATAAPYDIDKDGKAEMLVGLYSSSEENAEIYCIYENGTIEKKSDYKLGSNTFFIGEERFECGIDVDIG